MEYSSGVQVEITKPENTWKSKVLNTFGGCDDWCRKKVSGHTTFMYPPPPCISYALVQATVGVGTIIIVYVILIAYEM